MKTVIESFEDLLQKYENLVKDKVNILRYYNAKYEDIPEYFDNVVMKFNPKYPEVEHICVNIDFYISSNEKYNKKCKSVLKNALLNIDKKMWADTKDFTLDYANIFGVKNTPESLVKAGLPFWKSTNIDARIEFLKKIILKLKQDEEEQNNN